MPKGDRTGPMGRGAKSGRAAGFCAGYNKPGYANSVTFGVARMGMGRMRNDWAGRPAGGRGGRNRFGATGQPYFANQWGYPPTDQSITPEMEKIHLKNRSQMLQSELDTINQRLDEIA